MNTWGLTDEQLMDLLVDASLAGIEDGDGGAELRRLGNLHPSLRADLYAEVIAQREAIAKFGMVAATPKPAPAPVAAPGQDDDGDGNIWQAVVLLLGGATVAGAIGGVAVGGMILLGRWWAS